jgi:hypothetical protein
MPVLPRNIRWGFLARHMRGPCPASWRRSREECSARRSQEWNGCFLRSVKCPAGKKKRPHLSKNMQRRIKVPEGFAYALGAEIFLGYPTPPCRSAGGSASGTAMLGSGAAGCIENPQWRIGLSVPPSCFPWDFVGAVAFESIPDSQAPRCL